MRWTATLSKLPKHGELVIYNIGADGKANPYTTKVAQYDADNRLFVHCKADGDMMNYAMHGFASAEIVSGWIPFPDVVN